MVKFHKIGFFMQRFVCLIMAVFLMATTFALSVKTADAAAIITRQDKEPLFIEVSQGVLLKLDQDAANVFIANPLVADIEPKSTKLFYVFGLLPGSTTFYAVDINDEIIYSTTIEVTINIARIQETINKLIPTASIKIDSLSGIIILTGHALAPADADLAEQLVEEMLFDVL